MKFITCLTIFLCLTAFKANAFNKFDLTFETGGVWQNRNDFQIPPTSGTRFEMDQVDSGPFLHYRLEGYYRINEKHALRFVFAPSQIETTGELSGAVNFNGQNFLSGDDLTVKYKFNSYRLSYLFAFWGFEGDQLNLGITAKVRDAKISLSQNLTHSEYDNIGVVPLIYFEYQKVMTSKLSFHFTLDAAFAPQGRAVDGSAKVRYKVRDNLSLGLGFRSLEGGADNEKVYTFSWFHYVLMDLNIAF